ncbi:MAG: complex I NDUFA9 subunit family protein [Chloroflexota bacterium]
MILITGANGYVGTYLTRRLVDQGERPRCLVRRGARTDGLPHDAIDVVYGDVTDHASLDRAMVGVNTVVHLAAVTANIKESARVNYHRVNVEGTRAVVASARAAGVGRLVHISGIGAQPDGEGSWIRTRWEGDEAVREGGIPHTILQPSVMFGGKRAEFFQAQARVLRLSPVAPILGDGRFTFQPIWVEDVCTCILTARDNPAMIDRTITIGGPEVFTYEQIVDLLLQTLGMRKPKVRFPLAFMRANAGVAQAILPKPPITTGTLELFKLGANIAESLDVVPRLFGFTPRSLRDELREHGL